MSLSLVGKTLANRYRVDEFLGRGGMAGVYKVWDNRRMTYLAMKLLHEDLVMDKIFLRRFRREADNLARLQHPHIIRFYGLEQEGLNAFMLMDYVDGIPLKQKIFTSDARGLPLDEIRRVTRALCSALLFAHQEGLIHCDLKPGNVMIKPDGTVLLADFGIARMTDAATATMEGMGTPAYMAPEQVKGLDPVPQTDIYALGVVLFEMLTGGERPFTGERATTSGTMSAKVRWEQVNLAPPSPRQYNPKISPALEFVVFKCLAKNPQDRYQTPLELLNALEHAVGGEKTSVPAQPKPFPKPSNAERSNVENFNLGTGNWWQHRLTWVGIAGAIVLFLTFLLGKGRSFQVPIPEVVMETGIEKEVTAESAEITISTEKPSPEDTLHPTNTPTPTDTSTPTYTPEIELVEGSKQISTIDGMNLIYVPAGEFEMGSENTEEGPVHTVYLDAFWIDETEVTNVMFAQFVKETAYTTQAEEDGWSYEFYDSKWHEPSGADWRHPEGPESSTQGIEDHPVRRISWDDAQAYCAWAGRRLPTEAEWEKAARGTDGRLYPWGNAEPSAVLLNFDSKFDTTTPVGSYPPGASPYGALDMAGNVWEWVADWYNEDYYSNSPYENPLGPVTGPGRGMRGGSWVWGEEKVRATVREWGYQDASYWSTGFRCALNTELP